MMIEFRSWSDFLARLALSGIFIYENISHLSNLSVEVDSLVSPALCFSRELCLLIHGILVSVGLLSSAGILLSGVAGSSKLLRYSTISLLVFLGYASFVWWVRRGGEWIWSEPSDRRTREIHLMKNAAIAGGLYLHGISGNFKKSEESIFSVLRRIFLATRPWSLPASLIPILVVTVSLNKSIFSVATFAISVASLQAASNLLNSVADFNRKVDTKETSGDRTIVDGFISIQGAKYLAVLLTMIWLTVFSKILYNHQSYLFAFISAFGASIALTYSEGLKYAGFGDISVFLAFGPILAAATSMVCSDTDSIIRACAFSSPVSLLVVGILHANNIRDIVTDEKNGVFTVAVRIGRSAALIYFDILLFSPFLGLAILAQVYQEPGLVCAILAFPQALALRRKVRGLPVERTVDALTAQTMVSFGVSQAAGMFLTRYLSL